MRSPRFWAITLIALTYPIGKSLQQLIAGPQWLRHYLSDFGFVPFMVLAWVLLLRLIVRRKGLTEPVSFWVLPASIFFLGMALLGEAVQWIMGKGDPVDAACELLSAIPTVALLKNIQSLRWNRVGL